MQTADIAQTIIDNGYRVNVGATPAKTVAAYLSESINKEKSKSPFIKVDRGMYALRNAKSVPAKQRVEESDEAEEAAREMGLIIINAFGMFWDRNRDLLTFPWVWFMRLGRVVVGRGRLG